MSQANTTHILEEKLKRLSDPSDIAATLKAYLEIERQNHSEREAVFSSPLTSARVICLDRLKAV